MSAKTNKHEITNTASQQDVCNTTIRGETGYKAQNF